MAKKLIEIAEELRRQEGEEKRKLAESAPRAEPRELYPLFGDSGEVYENPHMSTRYAKLQNRLDYNLSPHDPGSWEQSGYESQTRKEALYNMFAGGIPIALSGVVDNFASNDPIALVETATGTTVKNAGNALHRFATWLGDLGRDNFAIYGDRSESLADVKYWLNQGQNVAYSAGLATGLLGEHALLAWITGGTGNAAAVGKTVATMGKLFGKLAKPAVFGAYKGLGEASLNGWETHKNVKEEFLALGFSEDEAEKRASEAAATGFRYEALSSMALGAFTMWALGSSRLVRTQRPNPFNRVAGQGPQFQYGYSNTVESFADRAFGNVKNKWAKGGIDLGVQIGAETVEEAAQTAASKYSAYSVKQDAGLVGEKTLGQILWDDNEMRDSMIGGALGGAFFHGTGKLKQRWRKDPNEYGKQHREFIAGVQGRLASYAEKMAAASSLGDKKTMEAIFDNAMEESAYNAIELDLVNQSEAAFESHVQQMRDTVAAIDANDAAKLKELGIADTTDLAAFRADMEKGLAMASRIKDQFLKNYEEVGDSWPAMNITKYQIGIDRNKRRQGEAEGRLEDLKKNAHYQELSDTGKRIFDLSAEQYGLSSIENPTDEHRARLLEVGKELQGLLKNGYTHVQEDGNTEEGKKKQEELDKAKEKDDNATKNLGLDLFATEHRDRDVAAGNVSTYTKAIANWRDKDWVQNERDEDQRTKVEGAKTETDLKKLEREMEPTTREKLKGAIEKKRRSLAEEEKKRRVEAASNPPAPTGEGGAKSVWERTKDLWDRARGKKGGSIQPQGQGGTQPQGQGAARTDGLHTDPLPRQVTTFEEARKAAKDAENGFVGKGLTNTETGTVAVVSGKNLEKMLSQKAVGKSQNGVAQAMAVANLDVLFERAKFGWEKADGNESTSIESIQRYFTTMDFGGKQLMVKLTVKKMARADQQNPLYTVEAVSFEEISPRASGANAATGATTGPTFTTSLGENIEKTPAATWFAAAAKTDGIDLTSTTSAGAVLSMAQAVEAHNSANVDKENGTGNTLTDAQREKYGREHAEDHGTDTEAPAIATLEELREYRKANGRDPLTGKKLAADSTGAQVLDGMADESSATDDAPDTATSLRTGRVVSEDGTEQNPQEAIIRLRRERTNVARNIRKTEGKLAEGYKLKKHEDNARDRLAKLNSRLEEIDADIAEQERKRGQNGLGLFGQDEDRGFGSPHVVGPENHVAKQAMAEKAEVLQGEAVAEVSTEVVPKTGGFKAIIKWAMGIFSGQGGKAVSPLIGEVVLDERAVETSMAHSGNKRARYAAFAAVKEVVEKGAVVVQAEHGNKDSFYISAPIAIDGRESIMTVLVHKDQHTQRMYIHSVMLKENLLGRGMFSVDTSRGVSERSDSPDKGGVSGNLLGHRHKQSGTDAQQGMERSGPTDQGGVSANLPGGGMYRTDTQQGVERSVSPDQGGVSSLHDTVHQGKVTSQQVQEVLRELLRYDTANVRNENGISEEGGFASKHVAEDAVPSPQAVAAMKTLLAELEKKLGRKPTFSDFVRSRIDAVGVERAEEMFDYHARAYEGATGEKVDLNTVYGSLFSAEALLDADFGRLTTERESERRLGMPLDKLVPPDVAKKLALESERQARLAAEKGRSPFEENRGEGRDPDDRRTGNPWPKFAYRFQQMATGPDGKRRITSRKLKSPDPSDPVDNRFILDPAFMERVRQESEADPSVLTARQMDDDGIPMGGGTTWGAMKAEKRKLFGEDSEDYRNWHRQAVPVGVVYSSHGTEATLAMLHTKGWYTEQNFYDPTGQQTQIAMDSIGEVRDLLDAGGGIMPIGIDNSVQDSFGQIHEIGEGAVPPRISEATGDTTLAMLVETNGEAELVTTFGDGSKTSRQVFAGRVVNLGSIAKNLVGADGAAVPYRMVHINPIGVNSGGEAIYMAFLAMNDSPVAPQAHLRNDLHDSVRHTIEEAVLAATLLNNSTDAHVEAEMKRLYGMDTARAGQVVARIKRETGIDIGANPAGFVGLFTNVYQEDGLYALNRNANLPDGVTYMNRAQDGHLEFVLKGQGRVPRHIGNAHGDGRAVMAAAAMLVGEKGWLSKMKLSPNMHRMNNGTKVTLVDAGGKASTKLYEDHMKDMLRTTVLSHKVETIDGKETWATDVQPMFYYSLRDADGKRVELKAMKEKAAEEQKGPIVPTGDGTSRTDAPQGGKKEGTPQAGGTETSDSQQGADTNGSRPGDLALFQNRQGQGQQSQQGQQERPSMNENGSKPGDLALFGGQQSQQADPVLHNAETGESASPLSLLVQETGLLEQGEKDILLALLESGMDTNGFASPHTITDAERAEMDAAGTNRIEGVSADRQRALAEFLLHRAIAGLDVQGGRVSYRQVADLVRGAVDAHLAPHLSALEGIHAKLEGQEGFEGALEYLEESIYVLEQAMAEREKLVGPDGDVALRLNRIFRNEVDMETDTDAQTETDATEGDATAEDIGDGYDAELEKGEAYNVSFLQKDVKLSFGHGLVLSLFGMGEGHPKTGRPVRGAMGLEVHTDPEHALDRLRDVTTAIPSDWGQLMRTLDGLGEKTGLALYGQLKARLESLPEHLRNEAMHRLVTKKATYYKAHAEFQGYEDIKNEKGQVTMRVGRHTVTVLDEDSGKALITLRRHLEDQYLTSSLTRANEAGDRVLDREKATAARDIIDSLAAQDRRHRALMEAVRKNQGKSEAFDRLSAEEQRAKLEEVMRDEQAGDAEVQALLAEVQRESGLLEKAFAKHGVSEKEWLRGMKHRAEEGRAEWERRALKAVKERNAKKNRIAELERAKAARRAEVGMAHTLGLEATKAHLESLRTLFDGLGLGSLADGTLEQWREQPGHYGNKGLMGLIRKELDRLLGMEGEVPMDGENHLFQNLRGAMRGLLDIEIALNRKLTGNAVHAGGKTSQAVVANTSMQDANQRLAEEGSPLLEAHLAVPYTSMSYVLRLLKTDEKVRKAFADIGFSSTEAYKLGRKKSRRDMDFDRLVEKDNLLALLAVYMDEKGTLMERDMPFEEHGNVRFRMGRMPVPTLSDKGRTMYMRLPLVKLDGGSASFDANGRLRVDEGILDFLAEQTFGSELLRILQAYRQETGIANYDMGAKVFHSLPSFNAIEVEVDGAPMLIHDLLQNLGGREMDGETMDRLREAAREKVLDYVNAEMEAKLSTDGKSGLLAEHGVWRTEQKTDEDGSPFTVSTMDHVATGYVDGMKMGGRLENLRAAMAEHALNSLLVGHTVDQLYLGDRAFYASGRSIPTKGDGRIDAEAMARPETYGRVAMEVSGTVQKRAASLIAPGLKLADSESAGSPYAQEFTHIALNDVEGMSAEMRPLLEMQYGRFDKKRQKAWDRHQQIQKKLAEEGLEKEERAKLKKEAKGIVSGHFAEMGAYFDITGTDAQEYTTWRTHLDVLLRKGDITREQHDGFAKKLESGKELSPGELAIVLQPMKPVYTGLVRDTAHGVMRPVYVKSSSFPLLPQAVANLKLDGLRQVMERLERDRGRPVRASYQSANKIGALDGAVDVNRIYDSTLTEAELEAALSVLPMGNFRIQQEVPSKEDKAFAKGRDARAPMGSQMHRMLLGNGLAEAGAVFDNVFSNEVLEMAGIETNALEGSEKEGSVQPKGLMAKSTTVVKVGTEGAPKNFDEARAYARENLQGRAFVNRDTGRA